MKIIFKFICKTLAALFIIFFVQCLFYLIFYNTNYEKIPDYDLVFVFPNEIERIKEGALLAQQSKKKLLGIAGATDEEYKKLVAKGVIHKELTFINSGLSHTTVRDVLCLKQISRDFDKIIVVTSQYHVPRVKLLLRLMLFKDYKKISIYAVKDNLETKNALFYKIINELKKMWGSIGELIIYFATGSVNEEYTKIRKISNFTKSILFLE